ncbi:MAG: hypothetical protein IJA69_02500, partial [Clostridia bacterium]|nr:hypothetical protein [Clostridia bacterium]
YREQYELYWLIAGTIDENGQTVALTEADKIQLNTGKMATDKNYYLLCGATLFGNFSSENYVFRTVPMQNNFQYGPSAETDTMLFDYPEITNIKDYSLSISRAYLTGHTVVTEIEKDTTNYTITPVEGGETSINMQNLYRLRGNIYSLIQKRSLTAIYKTLGYNNAEMEIPTDKADNLSSNEADAFWIPTKYDLDNLGDDIEAYSLESRENINAYYVHTQASSGHHLSIYNIDYTGVMRKYSCADIFPSQSYSVRPAFIL